VKKSLVGGGLLLGLGAVVLVGVLLAGNTSPRGWIGEHYSRTGVGAYRSASPPTRVAAEITRKFKPSDRTYDPSGVFLRYPSVVVAVLSDGARGSRIMVDDADRGYRRWYSHVGGRWGGPGGRSTMFRGGGPGAGK
jgi:hypothetical protein